MGFDIEMVVTQTAGQGNIADILDGFDIHAVIGFGRVGQAVSAYQTLQGGIGAGVLRIQEGMRFDFLMAVVDTVFQQGFFGKAAVEVDICTFGGDFGCGRTCHIACVTAAAVIGGIAFVFQHIGVGVQFFDKAQVFTRVLQVGVGLGSFTV